MKRKHDIPDGVIDVLREIGMTPREAGWDCHGTYVLLHKALEKVAAKRNVVFDEPQILSADVTSKEAVVLCVGRIGEKMEWSIGEAAPYNNKNSYPFAMAEKRAKDRVILKLVGLHGDVYAEDEADAFKESAPQNMPGTTSQGQGDPIEEDESIEEMAEQAHESMKKVEAAAKEQSANTEEVEIPETIEGKREFIKKQKPNDVVNWTEDFCKTVVGLICELADMEDTFDGLKSYALANKALIGQIKEHFPNQYEVYKEVMNNKKMGIQNDG